MQCNPHKKNEAYNIFLTVFWLNEIMICVALLSFYIVGTNSKFYAGRVKPGKFEYPKLNGLMSVDEATVKCEDDLACGGFTFKGSFRTKDIKMNMYFFHIVPYEPELRFSLLEYLSSLKPFDGRFEIKNNKMKYLYWSTYEVQRDFLRIDNAEIISGKVNNSVELGNRCERYKNYKILHISVIHYIHVFQFLIVAPLKLVLRNGLKME